MRKLFPLFIFIAMFIAMATSSRADDVGLSPGTYRGNYDFTPTGCKSEFTNCTGEIVLIVNKEAGGSISTDLTIIPDNPHFANLRVTAQPTWTSPNTCEFHLVTQKGAHATLRVVTEHGRPIGGQAVNDTSEGAGEPATNPVTWR